MAQSLSHSQKSNQLLSSENKLSLKEKKTR
jgi:hypothetical protein